MPSLPPNPIALKGAPVECNAEEFRAIVMPIVEIALFVQQVNQNTKPAAVAKHTEAFTQAKRTLCEVLQKRLGRPFWPDRLSNFFVSTAPYLGGGADVTFTETMPSKEGNIPTAHRVRLQISPETLQDRFRRFTEGNNPTLRGKVHAFALEVIAAMGI